MLPSRRNANFQEIEDRKNEKRQAKIDERSCVFWNIDFDEILRGFWEGFERPKPEIFAIVQHFFEAIFQRFLGKLKNRKN